MEFVNVNQSLRVLVNVDTIIIQMKFGDERNIVKDIL